MLSLVVTTDTELGQEVGVEIFNDYNEKVIAPVLKIQAPDGETKFKKELCDLVPHAVLKIAIDNEQYSRGDGRIVVEGKADHGKRIRSVEPIGYSNSDM